MAQRSPSVAVEPVPSALNTLCNKPNILSPYLGFKPLAQQFLHGKEPSFSSYRICFR